MNEQPYYRPSGNRSLPWGGQGEGPKVYYIGKAQLALQYFPDSTPEAACQRLRRAINRCKPLLEALANTGYMTTAHDFTPKQVALIYEYYGEP